MKDILKLYYDSVVIVATKHNKDGNSTDIYWEERGNSFANISAAEHWLLKNKGSLKSVDNQEVEGEDENS